MIQVFLADGFEEIEAIAVIDILRRAELTVHMVGVAGPVVRGAHGITVEADIVAEETLQMIPEAVILPGGMPGTLNLERSQAVRSAVVRCWETGGLVGAICAAPSVLGHMGLLNGKKATCFPGFEQELTEAQVQQMPVCIDGNLITANGPGSALAFGLAIVEALCGEEKARALGEGMQC